MKVISATVGLVLLTTAVTLSYLSNSNASIMIEKNETIVNTYIKKSKNALKFEDYKNALKFIRLAIQANPKSKNAFKVYENIIIDKYQLNEEETINTNNNNIKPQVAPQADTSESADMGC